MTTSNNNNAQGLNNFKSTGKMKTYSVLLHFDNGTDQKVSIDAINEGDARWAGKKIEGVYEAVVLNRI